MLKKLCSILIAFAVVFLLITPAAASTANAGLSSGFDVNETGVFFYDDCVVENVQVIIGAETINVTRTIYPNNHMVIAITENGVIRNITGSCDYQSLRTMLEIDASRSSGITPFERYDGYTYTYFTTRTQEYLYTPEAMTYYDIFNDLSAMFVDIGCFKLATLSTIAAIIAANSYAEVKTCIVVTENFYEETSGGEFISYLCEYEAKVYTGGNDGKATYIGSTTGDYNTLYI